MDAKESVVHYLQTDRTLRGGRDLYNKLPGKSKAFQNTLARYRDTPANLDKLYYELAKAVGLTAHNLKLHLQKPLVKAEDIQAEEQETNKVETLDDKLLAFNPEDADYQDAKKLAKALELKPNSQKKGDVYAALTEARSALVKKK